MNHKEFNEGELGKVPPQAVDVEETILGIFMLDSSVYDELRGKLFDDIFYQEKHAIIFRAIGDVASAGMTPDILSVKEQLLKDGNLDNIGGATYLSSLVNKVTSTTMAQQYLLILLEKYIKRQFIAIGNELMSGGFDDSVEIGDLLDSGYNKLEGITMIITGQRNVRRNIGDIAEESVSAAVLRKKNRLEGIINGIPTPLQELTKKTGGWMRGDMIVVAGRPGMGKTSVSLACMMAASKAGYWVNMYSLEMTDVRLVDRVICGLAGVEAEKYRDGYLSVEEIKKVEEAKNELVDERVIIDANPIVDMEYIHAQSRVAKNKGMCDMIIIDYLQLVETQKSKNMNRENEVSKLSRKAKIIAKDLNIPVLLLAQLNRGVELRGKDKRPMLADLRESGAIEQDADIVAFIYRPEVYGILEFEDGESTNGVGEILIEKHRNGSVGKVLFSYSKDLTRIYDYEKLPDYNIPEEEPEDRTLF